MRIDGAGGCFDNRLYEINLEEHGILLYCALMKWALLLMK